MTKNDIKYTIKIILLFLLISFVLDKIIYFSITKISDRVLTGQSIGKLNQYLKIKDSVDLIVFGSSRANHNVNPVLLKENSYNMGVDGRKLAYAATLIKLLPKNKKQIVLLQIDAYNAFSNNYDADDLDALLVKYNRNEIIKNEIDRFHKANIFQNFYWSISFNGKLIGIIKNYLKPKYNYTKYTGYDPIFPTELQKNIFKHKIKKEEKINCNKNYILNPVYNNYLDELKDFCNENNKTLILFTSPLWKDKCKRDNRFLKKILNNKGINYLDMTDVFVNTDSLIYWKDEEHLSYKGAEIFSKKLKIKLDSVMQKIQNK